MAKRYMVNPLLFAVSIAVCCFGWIMALILLSIERPGSAAIFAVIGMVYTGVAVFNGSFVTVDKTGVRRKTLGVVTWEKTWDEIQEVGICGTRVLRDPKSKNVGSLYLYFSQEKLDDKQRFDMVLKWPPLKKCYILHRYERMRSVQMLWDSKIETYNAGDYSFGEGLRN